LYQVGITKGIILRCTAYQISIKRRNCEKEYIEERSSLFWDVTQLGLVVLTVCAA